MSASQAHWRSALSIKMICTSIEKNRHYSGCRVEVSLSIQEWSCLGRGRGSCRHSRAYSCSMLRESRLSIKVLGVLTLEEALTLGAGRNRWEWV